MHGREQVIQSILYNNPMEVGTPESLSINSELNPFVWIFIHRK
jgi:hypothetical protein